MLGRDMDSCEKYHQIHDRIVPVKNSLIRLQRQWLFPDEDMLIVLQYSVYMIMCTYGSMH